MKKTILIIGGIVLVLALLGVWIYLLFFGAPENVEDVFADLSFGNGTEEVVPAPEPTPEDTDETDTTPETNAADRTPLRQVTVEPVAGMHVLNEEVEDTEAGTSTPQTMTRILYVEAGTGHIFEYFPETGDRHRISRTTIPETRDAYFAPNGSFVVNRTTSDLRYFDLSETDSEPVTLPVDGSDFHITEDNHLVYLAERDGTTAGVAYNVDSGDTETLFTTPLRDITVSWGSATDDLHVVYTTPAEGLLSQAYLAGANTWRRLPIEGYELNLLHQDATVVYSYYRDGDDPIDRIGVMYDTQSGESRRLATAAISQKCAFSPLQNEEVWCAHEPGSGLPLTTWYKGLDRTSDSLWRVYPDVGSSQYMVGIERESGRAVDVDDIKIHPTEETVLFRNKTDRSLWIYERGQM